MLQSARWVIRNFFRSGFHFRLELRPFGGDHFRHISRECGDLSGALGIDGVMLHEMTIIFHHHRAARCGHHNRLGATLDQRPPRINVRADFLYRLVMRIEMMRKCTTATARRHTLQRHTRGRQHASRRCVDRWRERVLHAVIQQEHRTRMRRGRPCAGRTTRLNFCF